MSEGVVQQDNIIEQDTIVSRAAIALQVFEEEYRILGIEEAVESIKGQIEAQPRRIDIFASAHHGREVLQPGRVERRFAQTHCLSLLQSWAPASYLL
jgi:hypothetical protein